MASEPKAALAAQDASGGAPTRQSRLDELARRYYAPLLSYFRKRTHNAPEVPDLVQQVFLRLAQRRQLGEIANTDGYIFRTASNTLKDHYRHEIVRERVEKDPRVAGGIHAGGGHVAGIHDSDFPCERVLEGQEALAQVVEGLRRLPDRTRDILMMRCFEGLKYSEIAHLYGISVRAVEKHMAKALSHLAQGVDPDAGGEG